MAKVIIYIMIGIQFKLMPTILEFLAPNNSTLVSTTPTPFDQVYGNLSSTISTASTILSVSFFILAIFNLMTSLNPPINNSSKDVSVSKDDIKDRKQTETQKEEISSTKPMVENILKTIKESINPEVISINYDEKIQNAKNGICDYQEIIKVLKQKGYKNYCSNIESIIDVMSKIEPYLKDKTDLNISINNIYNKKIPESIYTFLKINELSEHEDSKEELEEQLLNFQIIINSKINDIQENNLKTLKISSKYIEARANEA